MLLFLKNISLVFIGAIMCSEMRGQKQIPLDPSLKQNSERWTAKLQKQKPRIFYEFGAFKILLVEKIDTSKKEKEKIKFFRPLFGETNSSEYQELYYVVASYDLDTAHIYFTKYFRSYTHTPGFFSKKEETTSVYLDSIFVNLQMINDTTAWTIRTGQLRINYNVEGTLTDGDNEYFIDCINEFEGKESLLGPYPKGVVIRNKNLEGLAAMQLRPKKYTWFRNDLSPDKCIVISFCFSVIFSRLDIFD